MIESEGLDNLYARHNKLRDMTRAALRNLGFTMLAPDEFASPTVTVGVLPDGVTSKDIQQQMIERHGIYVATGIGPLNERAIRIGHMGWTHEEELERTFEALDDVLERIPVEAGSAS